ncbi:homocysteine-responsive endoplasmic reticulum-resident ubiquitin-like domain member 2 protein [Littorina saxatilis]|uniref:Ubiquitin-like domain-containing protein n=1 Tax=Littorina saxatilis TaxID=31220 RepID=A0AAN9C077_9CAEN
MNLAADLPVTLVVKAANQRVADQTVECVLGWTIRKLKQHLETVYPSKPKHHQQKLIYSGKLLADHLTLKEVLRQYDDENSRHTVHLVCSPSAEALSQPGPSQSFTDKKSEPTTNASQTSMSSGEGDGVRHRGSRAPNSTQSTTEVTNAGANPAMPVPGAAGGMGMPGMGMAGMPGMGMPGMPGMGMPGMGGMPGMLGMGGMAGMNMPMMGGAPGMGVPGYQYTPEQMAWMQQMYSQYMAQYMQYYGYQMPAAPEQANPAQAPAPQPAANAAPANNAPPNQNMRMNAQGGMEEDDEVEQRDWLDYIYVFFRFLVFVSVIYFYSSASRFLTVSLGFLTFYLLQNGWWLLHRRQQQQQPEQPPAEQPQPEQQQQQPGQQQQPAQQPQTTEGQNPQAQQNEIQAGEEPEAGEEAAPAENTQQAPPPADAPAFTPTVLLRMLVTFFTSLVPAPPPAVNAN